ncbi:MAG TPA: BlaI/MecI/CopY family transcriptional regulator [Patescibacteria group bacterium]|nr:BlaI/MecI/CopY family transcriptional regulator [Patescibacteria group bacterium]
MKKKEINGLGELENKVMETVWELGKASVRDVLNNIKSQKQLAYTTIMTVMSRLYDKNILKREFKNDAYIYAPVQDQKTFSASVSKKIINNLISKFGEDVAVAGFIDVMEVNNNKKSVELRKKLKTIIK